MYVAPSCSFAKYELGVDLVSSNQVRGFFPDWKTMKPRQRPRRRVAPTRAFGAGVCRAFTVPLWLGEQRRHRWILQSGGTANSGVSASPGRLTWWWVSAASAARCQTWIECRAH